jgi:hypothetical protein
VEWWQTLLVALATTVVTAVVTLVSAWLQHRRDVHAQQARETAETERLRLQLADAREQRQQDRAHADTLEWRERRLARYETASASARRLLGTVQKAQSVAQEAQTHHGPIPDTQLRLLGELLSDATDERRELLGALYRSDIIGTERTRAAAAHLSVASVAVGMAIIAVVTPSSANLPEARRELTQNSERYSAAFREWQAAVRAELGVPDPAGPPTGSATAGPVVPL